MAIAPLINGHRYSYASIELAITPGASATQIITDISGVNYDESLDIAYMQGTSRAPIGWTAGNYKPGTCELTMGKSTFTELAMTIGPGWLGLNFTGNIAYADVGEIVTVDTIVARFNGVADSHDYGPDALHVSLKCALFTILRNGIPPLLNRVF